MEHSSRPAPAKPASVASRWRSENISGTRQNGESFDSAASASIAPRAAGRASSAIIHASSAPTSASLVFRLSAYSVNGLAAQPNAISTPSLRDPSRQPATNSPRMAAMSKADAATCAAGRSSHRPLHPRIAHERDVRDVDGRAVGAAGRDRRLAAPRRALDVSHRVAARPVAAARRAVRRRERAPGRAPVDQPVGPHHAGVADVEDVRVLVVQPQPEADQREDRGHQDQRVRRPDRRAPGRRAEPDPGHPRGQVQHRRVDQRRGPEDLAVVEEPQRDRERRQHQQVERAQRDRPPPVHQARDEQQAHRAPAATTG